MSRSESESRTSAVPGTKTACEWGALAPSGAIGSDDDFDSLANQNVINRAKIRPRAMYAQPSTSPTRQEHRQIDKGYRDEDEEDLLSVDTAWTGLKYHDGHEAISNRRKVD